MTDETQTKPNDGGDTTPAESTSVEELETLGGGLGGDEPEGDGDAEQDNGAVDPVEASGEDGEPEPGEGDSVDDEESPEPSIESPDDYKFELADDIEWPSGMEVKIDENSDTAKNLRDLAFEEGLSQKAVNRVLDLHMREVASNLGQINKLLRTNAQAEIAKIGSERIAQVDAALRSHLGKEQAAKLFPVLSTAASYEAMEAIVNRLNEAPGGNRASNSEAPSASEKLKGRDLLEHVFTSKGNS